MANPVERLWRSTVGKPDLYAAAADTRRAPIASRRAGGLLKSLDRAGCLRVVARPGRQPAVAHLMQLAAERLLGNCDRVAVPQPLVHVDDAPSHDAMNVRDWAILDSAHQRLAVCVRQDRRRTSALTVDQSVRAVGVRLQHPVPDNLQRNAADRCGPGPDCAIIDGGQG